MERLREDGWRYQAIVVVVRDRGIETRRDDGHKAT
jgi:hypothetical protein